MKTFERCELAAQQLLLELTGCNFVKALKRLAWRDGPVSRSDVEGALFDVVKERQDQEHAVEPSQTNLTGESPEDFDLFRQCNHVWDVDLCRWTYLSPEGRVLPDGYYVVTWAPGTSIEKSANDANFLGPFGHPDEAQAVLVTRSQASQTAHSKASQVFLWRNGNLVRIGPAIK